jgi:hypothetical protein
MRKIDLCQAIQILANIGVVVGMAFSAAIVPGHVIRI